MQRLNKKILAALVLTALISVMYAPLSVQTAYAATKPTINITSQTVSDIGVCEIIGNVSTRQKGVMITCLMFEGTDVSKLSADKIIYINQYKTGTNGEFLIKFNVHWLRGGKQAQIRIGNNAGAPTRAVNLTLPPLPPDIGVVDDNSVMYGRDIYYVPGAHYTGDNAAVSLTDPESTKFGTDILYKIGGEWYNLSNNSATSNAYLTAENAMDVTQVELRLPRCYYGLTEKVPLKYILDAD